MQYFADDIKLPPCVKCFLTCFFSCPVRSLKNTFVIVSDLGKPRRQKFVHLFRHWSTFVLVMMKLMIMLMKITMIECVEKLDEKGPIILGLKTLPHSSSFTPGCRSQTEPEPENPELSYWTTARPITSEDFLLAAGGPQGSEAGAGWSSD